MPKDYFKLENITSFNDIPKNGKIYFMGVSGVAMGQLAVALSEEGYNVIGGDRQFYEPMGSFLRNSNVTLLEGYKASNVPLDADLVVIGNAIPYKFDEIAVVEENNLPYTCFPRLLSEAVISKKSSIVASGTHGKTTTTTMTAHVLREAAKVPSFFIGGVVESFGKSLSIDSKEVSVVEGDEYDDVFFSKKAKFLHYAPTTCIVNAVEFDHADLYESIEEIDKAFTKLVNIVPETGIAIVCADYDHLNELTNSWKKSSKCQIITFGESEKSDYRITNFKQTGMEQSFEVVSKDNETFTLELSVPGIYNSRNALASAIACLKEGLTTEEIAKHLKTFKPAKRRQEVLLNNDKITIISDFAHHPTAVSHTVQTIKSAYPDKKLWAVFEPRSTTSRRKYFQDDYAVSFENADKAIICGVTAGFRDTEDNTLNIQQLCDDINSKGIDCLAIEKANDICEHLVKNVGEKDLILIMSNGSFDGLMGSLVSSYS